MSNGWVRHCLLPSPFCCRARTIQANSYQSVVPMVARRNPVVPRRTVRVGGIPVQTTVTARPAVARRWVYTALWRQRRRLRLRSAGGLTVGLGVQWTPALRRLPTGVEPRPGTLQLCCGDRCLVLQLARLGGGGAVPQILRRFLADARVTFAGYYVAADCRKLRAHHGLEVGSTLELCRGGGGGGRVRESMADRLLGIRHGVEKPMKLGRSRWDGAKLSREQARYAAVDAYVACRLRCRRAKRPDVYAVHAAGQGDVVDYSDDDDDAWSTASEEALEEEPGYEHGGWGRFVGLVERVRVDQQEDWDEASIDDHVYDSIAVY